MEVVVDNYNFSIKHDEIVGSINHFVTFHVVSSHFLLS